MLKRMTCALMLAIVLVGFSGCVGGGDFFYRGWKHIQWHILGAYKDFAQLHREIDRYFFNLDERDPDRY